MFKAAWKSVLGHKARLALSTIAIILGIAFLSAVLSFNNMINSTIDGIVDGSTADVNVSAKGSYDANEEKASAAQMSSARLSGADLDKIRGIDGVQSASGLLIMQGVYPLGSNGKVAGNAFAPGMASTMPEGDAYGGHRGLVVLDGRKPTREGEVALDPTTLEKTGAHVGDDVKLAFSGPVGTITARVVGTATWGSGGSAGASYAFFDDRSMQKYAEDGSDAYTGAWVVAKPGTDVKTLTTRINQAGVLPGGMEAVDGKTASETQSKSFRDAMSFMTNFLLVFAAIGLIVSVFLIVNTFTILVAQRSRELALFRAMGASRGQVTRSVLFEALLIGILGSALGSLAGLGLAMLLTAYMRHQGADLGSATAALQPGSFLACVVVGTLTTVAAALLPARRAGRVPPVAAMSGEAMTGQLGLGKRAFVGVALAIAGIALLFSGLWLEVPKPLWWVGAGAFFTLIGVTFASPILGRPLTWLFERLYRAVFGSVGRLAAMNATRNPRRTAATASALMIGVTLVSAFSIMGNTAQNSLHKDIVGGLRAQLIVQTHAQNGWSDQVTRTIESNDGIEALHSYGFTSVLAENNEPLSIAVASADSFDRAFEQHLLEGRDATAAGELIVTRSYANMQHWSVGKTLTVASATKPLQLTVVGIYDNGKGMSIGPIITPRSTFDGVKPAVQPGLAFAQLKPGADANAVAQQITDATTDQPLLQVQTVDAFSKAMTAQVDRILAMLYGLLGVAVVIAVFGIVNTLVLSILERRREIGLLRAVGLRRGQLRTMIGLESVIIAVFGAALGIGMGLLFGWALAITAVGKEAFAIPWAQLGLFLILSIVVGIVAAIVPAIAASRMNTLRAIASD